MLTFSMISPAQNGKKNINKKASVDVSKKANVDANANAYTEDKINISVTIAQPEFVIKLKSNPTTGYSWFLREYNSELISPVKHYFQAETNNKLIGAPGYEIWLFKAKPAAFNVPQISSIRFIYARPWMSSDSSTQVVFHLSTQGK